MSEHPSIEIGAAGETGVVSATVPQGMPPLALLYSDETLLAHVESALGEMGAQVIYRASVAEADRAALLATRPGITLINLDDRCSEHLDQVTAWLDAARVPVVFNDADISHGLEGWARARWARHLAAKLRGSEDVDPPRPAQAEPAQMASSLQSQVDGSTEPAHGFRIASAEGVEIVPIASRPLTPGEIASLLADFPSELATNGVDRKICIDEATPSENVDEASPEAAAAGDDTDVLSAHVDALLAADAESTPTEPAPWEVIAPLEEAPAVAAANTSESPAPPGVFSSADWQLVDDVAVVAQAAPAPRERKPDPIPAAKFDFDFELEPLEERAPVVAREREFEEMRLEKVATKPAEANQ
jgi:two-component system chemotaxis response regulator CheB/chemosensory pili system protein ChpB (putative protein-glutamate methylesterase)